MPNRRVLLLVVAAVLLVGAMACDIGATATPTPAPTPTPLPTATSEPTPLPTPEPTATTEEVSTLDMVTFEEPNGAFSVDHPTALDDIELVPDMGDLGYAFQGTGSDSLLFVSFGVLADEALTGFEWQSVARELGPQVLSSLGESFGAGGEFQETTRQMGSGTNHTMYLEATSDDTQLHMAAWLEEGAGVLTMVFWFVPEDSWEKTSEMVTASLDSYTWAPDVVRSLAPVGADGGAIEDTIQDADNTSAGFLTYESEDGVFDSDYPVEYDQITGPDVDEDGYSVMFQTEEGENYIGFFFAINADTGFTDEEWAEAAVGMVETATSGLADDAVEVYHEEGDPGVHWVYTEAESASEEARQGLYLEESDGVLAMMMFWVGNNEWAAWEPALIDSLASFQWSPQAVRDVLESGSSNGGGTVEEPTSTPLAVVEPTAEPEPGISGCYPPSGQGGLIMFNCRSDVVTVDVIPDGIFQQLEAASGGDCRQGDFIYLNPGDHILRAAIAGVPSQGESTINIVAGECLPFSWQ